MLCFLVGICYKYCFFRTYYNLVTDSDFTIFLSSGKNAATIAEPEKKTIINK